MRSIKSRVYEKIKDNQIKTFTSSDFLDLGSYKSVSKALEKLEDEKLIRRVVRGIYDVPEYSELLQMYSAPIIDEVANALARQYNWTICPSGNFALNIIGISTQVPARYVFVSNGPYREYDICGLNLQFKHTTSKEVASVDRKILIAIQAIKAIGKGNLSTSNKNKIKEYICDCKDDILSNKISITSWIYEELVNMIGG